MPKAFVMVDIEPGCERFVQEAVQRLRGVQLAYQITGAHDLITFLDAEPYEKLAKAVAGIRRVEHVRSTETLLVLA